MLAHELIIEANDHIKLLLRQSHEIMKKNNGSKQGGIHSKEYEINVISNIQQFKINNHTYNIGKGN